MAGGWSAAQRFLMCFRSLTGCQRGIAARTGGKSPGERAMPSCAAPRSWAALPKNTVVSMNLFNQNLKDNPLKCEYFLPFVVDEHLREKKADVKVLRSADSWYGVTY